MCARAKASLSYINVFGAFDVDRQPSDALGNMVHIQLIAKCASGGDLAGRGVTAGTRMVCGNPAASLLAKACYYRDYCGAHSFDSAFRGGMTKQTGASVRRHSLRRQQLKANSDGSRLLLGDASLNKLSNNLHFIVKHHVP